MQEKGRMKLDEGYQEDLESMDHKSPELLALACGVLSGWWLSGWFRYSHPDATPARTAHCIRAVQRRPR